MKFRAHETFSLRKGWLHKGIKNINELPRLFIDKNINSQDILGIGSNMVKSLRYWLQATGLAEEITENGNRIMVLTEIGETIWKNDQYFEEDGTWFLIHYLLSSNMDLATSWYVLFNEMNLSEFNKDDFISYLKIFIEENTKDSLPSERVINDDFECLVKTYYNTKKSEDPETNFICPLTELGLLKVADLKNKFIVKTAPKMGSIHPLVILAIIVNCVHDNSKEIKITDIENEVCNIGRTFNLDNISVAYYLEKLQNMEYLKLTRTAGLDIVQLKTEMSFNECVQCYYDSIRNKTEE